MMIKFESKDGFETVFFEPSGSNNVEVSYLDEFWDTDPEIEVLTLSESKKIQAVLREKGFREVVTSPTKTCAPQNI